MTEKRFVTESQKDSIAQALSQVAADGDAFMNGNSDSEARERLVSSARQLVAAAETPVESLLWNIWALVSKALFLVTNSQHTPPSAWRAGGGAPACAVLTEGNETSRYGALADPHGRIAHRRRSEDL